MTVGGPGWPDDELEFELVVGESVVVTVLVVRDWLVLWQVCVTATTGRVVRVCGSTAAPGARLTSKLIVCPPATVIVTLQGSAEAGIETTPSAATAAPAEAAAIFSFSRPNT